MASQLASLWKWDFLESRNGLILSLAQAFQRGKKIILSTIGPLQPAIHVVQSRHAGEQKSHWDKTNKRHT